MRKEFAEFLHEIMSKDSRVYLITGDLGYGVLDRIRQDFPSRFINVGASEQLMVGMAVGMAQSGLIPLCYSITPFVLYRPFEIIRNYMNYEKAPVKLVGAGRSKDYALGGISHWADDDVQIVEAAFPNVKMFRPERENLMKTFEEFMDCTDPCYINLGR